MIVIVFVVDEGVVGGGVDDVGDGEELESVIGGLW